MKKFMLLSIFVPAILISQIKTVLITNKRVYRLGESIHFEIIMINNGDRAVIAGVPVRTDDYLILLKENGERIKMHGTAFWITREKYIKKGILYPHTRMQIHPPSDLYFQLFILPRTKYMPSGKYYLVGIGAYKTEEKGEFVEVPSDTVEIEVIEPEGIDRKVFEIISGKIRYISGYKRQGFNISRRKLAMKYPESVYAPELWVRELKGRSLEEKKAEVEKFLRLYKNSVFSIHAANALIAKVWPDTRKIKELKEWFLKIYGDGKWRWEIENQFNKAIGKTGSPQFQKRLQRLEKAKKRLMEEK